MQNPAGIECKFFFGDYFRGRTKEECRLLSAYNISWDSDLCKTCPVPDIFRANSCDHQLLTPEVYRPFLSIKKHVKVTAFCEKTQNAVKEPYIGCGDCHPIPPVFLSMNDDTLPHG